MFFYSSRRRHTRLQGDWSSDVCSSDLLDFPVENRGKKSSPPRFFRNSRCAFDARTAQCASYGRLRLPRHPVVKRSEERRVGKEWSKSGTGQHEKNDISEERESMRANEN